MYNRRHCYPHKSTDSARQKPETHAPIPKSKPSAFGLQTRCSVLSIQWLCFSLISYSTVAVEKHIPSWEGSREGRASPWLPDADGTAPCFPLGPHAFRESSSSGVAGRERWTRLSAVAGRDPNVKRREDALVLRCEASLLLKRGKT